MWQIIDQLSTLLEINPETGIMYNTECTDSSEVTIGFKANDESIESRIYKLEDCKSCKESIQLHFGSQPRGYLILSSSSDFTLKDLLKLKVIEKSNSSDDCDLLTVVSRKKDSLKKVLYFDNTLHLEDASPIDVWYKLYEDGSLLKIPAHIFRFCNFETALLGSNYTSADIESYAFSGNGSLQRISTNTNIPSCTSSNSLYVRSIGNSAFNGCSALTRTNDDSNSPKFNCIVSNSIGDYAFNGTGIKNISIRLQEYSNELTIGSNVFKSCPLKTITITTNSFSQSPIKIKQSAFEGINWQEGSIMELNILGSNNIEPIKDDGDTTTESPTLFKGCNNITIRIRKNDVLKNINKELTGINIQVPLELVARYQTEYQMYSISPILNNNN